MSKKIGEEKVHEFRRSWDINQNLLKKESPYHPINIETYKEGYQKKLYQIQSL